MAQLFARHRLATQPDAQSDEVREAFPREEVARVILDHEGFAFDGESICDEADRIFGDGNPRLVRAVALADKIAATLRNQAKGSTDE